MLLLSEKRSKVPGYAIAQRRRLIAAKALKRGYMTQPFKKRHRSTLDHDVPPD